ncbi:hypothetical protein [Methylobacterium sp. ID0610]
MSASPDIGPLHGARNLGRRASNVLVLRDGGIQLHAPALPAPAANLIVP